MAHEDIHTGLTVKIASKGSYRLYAGDNGQLFMQSPVSGLYMYEWDRKNGQWKSATQEHIMEDLLVRELLTMTNSVLKL